MTKSASSQARRPLTLGKMRPIVHRITREYGAKNVRIFGSFARGEQRKTSDVDLLVDLPEEAGLLELVALKRALEAALNRKVDVVTDGSLSPYLGDRILRDATLL